MAVQSPFASAIDPSPEVPREVRIALVLYGGVSLAVYENGVTRCFYELVRERGPLGFVAKLLDAKVAVDVIAGSSAGGINGLLLAAALENGTDFAGSARLWRDLGDLGGLLRPVGEARTASSLLAGETRYQQNLETAFRGLCNADKNEPSAARAGKGGISAGTARDGGGPAETASGFDVVAEPVPFEIDVFITGTDLAGRERRYLDATGSVVDDRYHRVVFHLKYRPNRRYLGCANGPGQRHRPTQARILASIARITSSFPGAFPPFVASVLAGNGPTIPREGQAIAAALQATGRFEPTDGVAERRFLDGGVLSNKPFGPALRAIFHRMPKAGLVDRRLFFVEPDPASSPAPAASLGPFVVPLRAIRLPAHESIADQLAELRAHNAQLAWLSEARKQALSARAGVAPSALYLRCRLDALALALLARDEDRAPAARDIPHDETDHARFRELVMALEAKLTGGSGAVVRASLDAFDVDYQLRRAFHLLYALHDQLDVDGPASGISERLRLDALIRTGRVVKALKIVRDQLVVLRNAIARAPAEAQRPDVLIGLFRRFIDDEASHWKGLRQETADDPFPTAALTRAAGDAAKAIPHLVAEPVVASGSKPLVRSVLARIAGVLDAIAARVPPVPGAPGGAADLLPSGAELLQRFDAVDAAVFPLQFASGIYELDRIELVRVSPVDAQLGLSKGSAREKIAGDALGHFAAFLRRDWRANDLFMGRLDGACQIVRGLLDDDAMSRLARRSRAERPGASPSFAAESLAASFPGCPARTLDALAESWNALGAAWQEASPSGVKSAAMRATEEAFREALVLAIHGSFFAAEREEILTDRALQDLWYDGEAASAELERRARELARKELRTWNLDDLHASWERYRKLDLGASRVRSRDGVPTQFLVQYVMRTALFASAMFEQTFASHRAVTVLRGPFSVCVRLPLHAVHAASVWIASSRGRPVRRAWNAARRLGKRIERR